MKISVTRQDALHNPLSPPRPLVVDTEALSPDDAARLDELAAAARAGTGAAPGRQDLALQVVIEDGGATDRIEQAEGSLTPEVAALVDAVSRLA
jgi:hypothetical protein